MRKVTSLVRPIQAVLLFVAATTGPSVLAGEPVPAPPPIGVDTLLDKGTTNNPKMPKSGADAALPAVDWSAAKQSFVEDKDALILSGAAWIRYQGNKLEADQIVIFRQTKEMYAEGNIRLRVGESELAAQAAYIDLGNDTGYLVDAVVRVSAPPTALQGLSPGSKSKKTEEEEEKRDELRHLSGDKLGDKYTPSYLRTRDPYGLYLEPINDPQARTNLVFKANKVIKNGKMQFTAEDAFVTNDDMVHPMYGVKAGTIDFFLREVPSTDSPGKTELKPHKIVAKRARINIAGVSLFPFPTITYDLVRKNPYFQVTGGSSDRWGPYVLSRFGFNLNKDQRNKLFNPTDVYLDLDERWKRGPAIGGELNWTTGVRPHEDPSDKNRFEQGQGHIRAYALGEWQTDRKDDLKRARRDLERRIQPKLDGDPRQRYDANILFTKRRKLQNAGPASLDLEEYRDETRGYVDFAHHQPLKRFAGIDNLQLDFKYEQHSDRDFMLEYYPHNYLTENQPEAMASIRKPGDNYSIELLYRTNPTNFDGAPPRSAYDYGTFTGYEPAVTYSLTPTPLPYGFYMSGEVQGARMTRDFEKSVYEQNGFNTERLYGKVDMSRPFKWGALNFVPHVGTQQMAYTDSIKGNGDEITQGALTYGLDVTSRIYGTYNDFENEALGIRGFRHIIEPRISWGAVGETRETPEHILDFDEVDDLTPVDKVTFSLEQTFQTKRPGKDGTMQSVNFAGFDMSMDYFPQSRDRERLFEDADKFSNLKLDGFLRVVDVLKVDGSAGISIEDGKVETAVVGVTIDPRTRWKLRFEERYTVEDNNRAIFGSDQYRLRFEYKLTERWQIFAEGIHEKRKSLLQRKGRQVTRVGLTRNYGPVDATFTYSVDENLGDSTFFVTMRPTFAYRNVIVPQQDLIVAEGEVTGDDATPEEVNFDPFELLKNRGKKKRTTPTGTKTDVPAPPPGTIKDQDVPIPPPPTQSTRKDARAELFRDPNESQPAAKRRPTRLDDDEWTAPPATPASARP